MEYTRRSVQRIIWQTQVRIDRIRTIKSYMTIYEFSSMALDLFSCFENITKTLYLLFRKYCYLIRLCNFLDQGCFDPHKFYGRDMSGILFFIFASCEPLTDPSPKRVLFVFDVRHFRILIVILGCTLTMRACR